MANKPPQPPPIGGVEVVPFTLTLKGEMTVPAGTAVDMIKASVMSQVNFSASLAHLIKEIDIQTGASGLTLAKG